MSSSASQFTDHLFPELFRNAGTTYQLKHYFQFLCVLVPAGLLSSKILTDFSRYPATQTVAIFIIIAAFLCLSKFSYSLFDLQYDSRSLVLNDFRNLRSSFRTFRLVVTYP